MRAGVGAGRASQYVYLAVMTSFIAAYPALPASYRRVSFSIVALAAIAALILGALRVPRDVRLAWWLLVVSLVVVNIATIMSYFSGPVVSSTSDLLDSVSTLLTLAAALALVIHRGRHDLGIVLDAAIVAVALGGLLWDGLVRPHLASDFRSTTASANILIAVFALCGVLGALTQLMRVSIRRPSSLWLLAAALGLALAGYVVLAIAADAAMRVGDAVLFMGLYTALGLFGLDPTAPGLATRTVGKRENDRTSGRLVFLGAAIAAIPVVAGLQSLAGVDVDGPLLVVGPTIIAALVMLRIGELAAARARAREALSYEASHDSLTGLANRREFVRRLGDHLRSVPACVILFCDLDDFKATNDRLGHWAGDELLVEVARRLAAAVRRCDLVGRFGGDEFVVLFGDHDLPVITVVCERIGQVLSQPIMVGQEAVPVGVSMGLTIENDPANPEDAIMRADRAMYAAKQSEPVVVGVRIVVT